jgi:S-DNA-T family DNA segregation ATPase FtsK/SpoIIIE
MALKMRRHTPSDQVMVPASRDPFESPKWAPPIWHMPEGLVLLVNLMRGLVRGVVFALRHFIATTILVGLGWLWWRYDWPAPALVIALAAMALGVWAGLGWTSFQRRVAFPAWSRWRHVWVYRRHWQPVMVMSGLAFYRHQREYLPTIRAVVARPATDRVLVQMLSGQAPGIWADHAPNLAHGFGAHLCRVRAADKPGRIWLEFVRKDTLAEPIDALPIPGTAAHVELSGLEIGRCEDGSPWRLRVLGTHVLVAGATGAGKGSVIWSTIRAMLPAMRAGLVQVWGLDPKRMELAFGRDIFHRYSDDPAGGMVELLEAAVVEMQERAGFFGGKTRTFAPSRRFPFLLIVVDELAFLTAYCPQRELRKRAEAALATLTSQGRSVGVCVLGALQDLRKEVVNIRNLFPDRIALRLDEAEQVDMALGDGARDRGALADQISTIPQIGAGVGYIRLEATPDPVRARAAFVTDTQIRAMATYLHPDPAPTVPIPGTGEEARA